MVISKAWTVAAMTGRQLETRARSTSERGECSSFQGSCDITVQLEEIEHQAKEVEAAESAEGAEGTDHEGDEGIEGCFVHTKAGTIPKRLYI